MKRSFDNYRRLAKGTLGMSSLWMGPDHLVFVKGSGFLINFTEHYRRFRYQDIQYLAITKTSRVGGFVMHSLGLLTFVGILAGILMLRDAQPLNLFFIITYSILAAGAILFLLLLTRHALLGPTCFCDLKTNLKQERLTPLGRLHLANQAVDVLEEVIAHKQEHLLSGGPENTESNFQFDENRMSIGRTVLPAFIDYTVFGLIALAALHLESIALCAAGLVLIILGNLMLFRSLIRSYQYATPEPIRKRLFLLLSSVMIFGGIALVYFIQIVSANTIFLQNLTGPFEAFASIPTLGGIAYYGIFLVATLLVFSIALSGLIQTLKWQKRINETMEATE